MLIVIKKTKPLIFEGLIKELNTAKNEIIIVGGIPITTFKRSNEDYISLTDMANSKDGASRAADGHKEHAWCYGNAFTPPRPKGHPSRGGEF